ncbi:MAG: MbcA/ParS/Xre antitoxin family protein [Rhodospirillaceae bacterium]|nr:MbcA/ParS/Xre antitoxin family protein [Rhodospirillaceae bacterium]
MQFQDFVADQVFSPTLIADTLRTTKAEIAGTLGLGKDVFTRTSRVRARKTQVRLRQMLEILNRVEGATGSPIAAYAWFRAEPLPGFGGATPDQLVREGRAEHVHAYLDRIMAGGYA